MNGKKVISACKPRVEEIVNDLGYVLVDIEYKKQSSGMVLEIIIDNDEGIKLSDCERVSRALDDPLDEINPTNDAPYSLNVSSMGLDRPLTTDYQLNKYKGKEVHLKFYSPQFGVKEMDVELLGFTETELTVNYKKEELVITRTKIANIVPVIKF